MSLPAGKWGVAYTIEVPVPKRAVVDFSVSADWTPATGDSKISKDGGNVANTSNLPAILGGTGAAVWQHVLTATEMQATSRVLVQYVDSATKAVEDQAFVIPIDYGIRSNTAQGGAAGTITLDASASSVDDFYVGEYLEIIGGTGVGQKRRITAYNGTSKVVTVNRNWATTPDNTSIFRIGFLVAAEVNTTHISGTAQTARDLGASVLLSSGTGAGQLDFTSGVVKSNWVQILGTAITGTAAQLAAAITKFFNVATPTGTVNSLPDAVPGASGGLAIVGSVMGDSAGVATLLSRLSAARAGYLDFLNIGGAVASQADINALNQSASRRVILQTVGQYERPESGSTVYAIEARTYDGDGAVTNADSTPTLTATGTTSGSLAANLGTASNPATGVYRWDYTVANNATIEPVRFDFSATIGAAAFPMACYTQVVDSVSATWTTADRTKLTAVYDKLPSTTIADQTLLTSVGSDVVSVLDDTAELQGDWANGGRLDLLLDGMPAAVRDVNNTSPAANSLGAAVNAVSVIVTAIQAIFAGMTSLPNWLRRLARKDAGTAGMATAETEIDTGGTSTFTGTTDNLEAIKDAGGGGGGGGLTEENIEDIAAATAVQVASVINGLSGETNSIPIANGGKLRLRHGDDYLTADGRQRSFTVTGIPADWSTGTSALRLRSKAVSAADIPATSLAYDAGTLTVSFDVAAEDFSALDATTSGKWSVFVTPATGGTITPIEGILDLSDLIPLAE